MFVRRIDISAEFEETLQARKAFWLFTGEVQWAALVNLVRCWGGGKC